MIIVSVKTLFCASFVSTKNLKSDQMWYTANQEVPILDVRLQIGSLISNWLHFAWVYSRTQNLNSVICMEA